MSEHVSVSLHLFFDLFALCSMQKLKLSRGSFDKTKSTYEFKCTAPPFWLLWCLCLNDWAFTPELKLHLTYPLQAAHFTTSAASSHPGYKQNPFIFPVIYNPRMNKIPHAESFNFACVITRHCKLQPVPALLLQSTHRHMSVREQRFYVCVTFAAAQRSNFSFEHGNVSGKVKDRCRLSAHLIRVRATNMACWQRYKLYYLCSKVQCESLHVHHHVPPVVYF